MLSIRIIKEVVMENKSSSRTYHIAGAAIWLRLAFMLGFVLALQISVVILGVLAVVQFVFALADGQPNQDLVKFSRSLVGFVAQIWAYLTFTAEDKPFPFSDWPE